jgi:hypothetical protein
LLSRAEQSRAYRVGDDQDVGVRGGLGSSLGQVTDDGGVGVEQIVTGHTGLAGDTSGDQDNLGILQAGSEASLIGVVASDNAVGVDVAEISGDTWGKITDQQLQLGREGGSSSSRVQRGIYAYRVHHGYRRERGQRHGG